MGQLNDWNSQSKKNQKIVWIWLMHHKSWNNAMFLWHHSVALINQSITEINAGMTDWPISWNKNGFLLGFLRALRSKPLGQFGWCGQAFLKPRDLSLCQHSFWTKKVIANFDTERDHRWSHEVWPNPHWVLWSQFTDPSTALLQSNRRQDGGNAAGCIACYAWHSMGLGYAHFNQDTGPQ